MDASAIVSPLIGGILIGLSASLLYATQGRVAGISGILAGLFTPKSNTVTYKWAFILGLFVAGTVLGIVLNIPRASMSNASIPMLLVAGLLVGFGARLANGCTSGHSVCGISRLSLRSIVATALFILFGAGTVVIARQITGVVS